MGKEESVTDNSTSGGLTNGVAKNGFLNAIGFQNNTGDRFKTTDSVIQFKEIEMSFMDKIFSVVNALHKKNTLFQTYFLGYGRG